MGLDDIPIFAMLKSKLGYVNARQKVLSENVANADTPGYTPKDLKAFTFDAALKGASGAQAGGLAMTQAGHMAPRGWSSAPGGEFHADVSPDSEVRVDGNQVVLEEQMSKLTQARIDYEAAVDFYQQSMNLINTAARASGKAA